MVPVAIIILAIAVIAIADRMRLSLEIRNLRQRIEVLETTLIHLPPGR